MVPLNIGVITKYTANCYHGGLIHAIHQELIKNNANMYVINTFMIHRFYNGQEKDLLYYKLALNHIDGWIVLSEGANDQFIEMLCNTGKPLVTIGFTPKKIKCPAIKEDSRHSGEAVTQHLIDHGHKKIVFIGSLYLEDMYKRFEGYKRALEKNLIPFDPNLCIQTEAGASSFGKSGIQKMLANGCEFTAVFGANDFLALGAVRALKEVGLNVPEDVAVIGYDDTSHGESSNPSLTSVRQDYSGMGTAAVEALMRAITEKTLLNETTYVKSSIVIRNSCECKKQSKRRGSHTNDDKLKVTLEYMEEELSKNIDLSFELLKTNTNEIKKIASKIVSRYSMQCIGFWYSDSNKEKKLIIQEVVDKKSKTEFNPNRVCPIEDFPPCEFLPHIKNSNTDEIVWILPITTVSRDWCIIAYVSPFNVASTSLAYDSWTIFLNLLGGFLDHEMTNYELKKALETLQKTQEQLIQSEKMVSLGT
ncbi:MAG TPA: substrate-binding domain-containing protein, partial [Clostridia bacterium]